MPTNCGKAMKRQEKRKIAVMCLLISLLLQELA
jgi:hypothetical protein